MANLGASCMSCGGWGPCAPSCSASTPRHRLPLGVTSVRGQLDADEFRQAMIEGDAMGRELRLAMRSHRYRAGVTS